MSVEAISWAFAQPIKHSTAKFVLVAMANHADGDMMCWPSTVHLCAQTSQDRKTVQANVARLRDMGYIEDTGFRKGTTKQVIVYRLKEPEFGPVSKATLPKNEAGIDPENDAENALKGTENGPVKEAQISPCTKNETGPFFPPNRPVFPTKEARFSHITGPKTGHGTIIKPSRNHQGNHHKETPAENSTENGPVINLPDWLPSATWQDWVEYRKSIKAKLSPKAAQLCITTLTTLRTAGNDPVAVIEQTIMSGKWTGLFPLKQQQPQRTDQGQKSLDDINAEAKRIALGNQRSRIIDV